MPLIYKERGGGWMTIGFGWWLTYQATWPFAKIEIYSDKVVFSLPFQTLELLPREIRSVSRIFIFPFLIDGVKVSYKTMNESSFFVFWSFCRAGTIKRILTEIGGVCAH